MNILLREAGMQMWINGYQAAIEAMRELADEIRDEQAKRAVSICADMLEAGKPTVEQMQIITDRP